METFLNATVQALIPIYQIFIGIAAPIAVAWIVKILKDRAGIALEESDRNALQIAIKNAALLAVNKSGGAKAIDHVASGAIDDAVDYVKTAVPDAVERFRSQGLDDRAIAAKIAPQAQLIVDSVPTQIVDEARGVATDAFVRSVLNR